MTPEATASDTKISGRQRVAQSVQSELSKRILVNVKRDMTDVAPRVIWMHEKPILEEIFGEGSVKDIDQSSIDDGYKAKIPASQLIYNKTQDQVRKPSEVAKIGYVFTGDKRAEYERLVNVYGRHPDENVSFAEKVFGRFQKGDFSAMLGNPSLSDLPDAQIRELIESFGFIPILSDKPTDSEKAEYQAARKRLFDSSRAELMKLADEVGVELT